MKDSFKNKVVLITSAAQGIGLAAAQEFAKVGTGEHNNFNKNN